jgi:hypothetical protein
MPTAARGTDHTRRAQKMQHIHKVSKWDDMDPTANTKRNVPDVPLLQMEWF